MLRVRKTRSSLLAPALLVELAAETGTVLRVCVCMEEAVLQKD